MRFISKLLPLSFLLFVADSRAQQLTNGGLENWDSSGFTEEVPVDWLVAQSYFSLPCYPSIFTTEKTNDAHSGDWAAKLETKFCEEDGGTPKAYTGLLACGDNTSYPHLPYGTAFSERPAFLNFYCKFLKAGTDTGYASIRLITIDSTGNLDQVIAEGSIDIINNISSYTLFSVPLNYYTITYPHVIQVLFSTSKTLAVANMLAASPPGNGASLGTTLWIDDVYLSGGTMHVEEKEKEFPIIFPNPIINKVTLRYDENFSIENIYLTEIVGRAFEIPRVKRSGNEIEIDLSHLPRGIYFLHIGSRSDWTKLVKL